MKRAYFYELEIGDEFEFNSNKYEKITQRTALLLKYDKVFYFGLKDMCKLIGNENDK